MTHQQYLEAFHELTTRILSEMALRHGKGKHTDARDLLTDLRKAQDKLWDEHRKEASKAVKP